MAAKKLLALAIENDTRETYLFVSHAGTPTTRGTLQGRTVCLGRCRGFIGSSAISAQRRVLSDRNIVKNDILKRVGEYGDGNEDGYGS
jgi:hypothetical protein